MTAHEVVNQGLVQVNWDGYGWATVPVASDGTCLVRQDTRAKVGQGKPECYRRPSDLDVLRYRQRELERGHAA